MAIIIQNKFALDSLGYKTIGFAFPISSGGVFPPTYTVKEQLRYNLINYLMTNPGESYLNPDFGAGLPKFIFEQINTQNLESIKTIIQNKITVAFPSIKVQQVDVYGNENYSQIRIVITYNILNFGNDQITLQF